MRLTLFTGTGLSHQCRRMYRHGYNTAREGWVLPEWFAEEEVERLARRHDAPQAPRKLHSL